MTKFASSWLAGLERWRPGIRAAVYLIGLQPAIWTFYLALNDQLGADPLKTLERTLGLWSLRFLVAGLAITPLRRLGGPNLVRYRRAIGLLAFFYALFHFSVYALLDQGLDLAAIWNDIVKRPFITVGMLALAILVPLAVTSNNAMIKRLGGAAWQRLHRWVYLACAAAALHFIMLVKSWSPEPIVYAIAIAALLFYRAANKLQSGSNRPRRARAASTPMPSSRTSPFTG
jgi:methionine sulfoxide reductase heme-binding subunit